MSTFPTSLEKFNCLQQSIVNAELDIIKHIGNVHQKKRIKFIIGIWKQFGNCFQKLREAFDFEGKARIYIPLIRLAEKKNEFYREIRENRTKAQEVLDNVLKKLPENRSGDDQLRIKGAEMAVKYADELAEIFDIQIENYEKVQPTGQDYEEAKNQLEAVARNIGCLSKKYLGSYYNLELYRKLLEANSNLFNYIYDPSKRFIIEENIKQLANLVRSLG